MTPLALIALLAAPANPLWSPETPNNCESCAGWNKPHAAVHVFGNTWWVGVDGLSVIAIDTGAGIVLLDGALPQSVPNVAANLKAAGLDSKKVKLIGNSHAHYDHAGGIAALAKLSGAKVLASPSSAQALTSGCPTADDPQVGFGCEKNGFPQVKGPIQVIGDGEVITLGTVALTAHFTPGHTTGSTTWTWKACEGKRCLDVVYSDSLTAVSADGFSFAPLEKTFRASIARVGALPCDVVLTAHPDASDTIERLSMATKNKPVDPSRPRACAEYAARATEKLDARLKTEGAARSP